jgi:glycerol-3-phosphate dehydrogenase
MAEVLWAVKNEMAVRVEDVLSRRIRMLILDAQAALDSAEKVARLMAKELQKDENWIQEELIAFKKVAEKYLIKA